MYLFHIWVFVVKLYCLKIPKINLKRGRKRPFKKTHPGLDTKRQILWQTLMQKLREQKKVVVIYLSKW